MNSSSVPAFAARPRSASRASWRRRICRGEATTSRPSSHSRSAISEHRALVPRDRPQRVEVGLHHEVAVAALPRGHLVAARRCPCRRRRRAGSCSPPRRARRPRRGSGGPSAACPAGGPPCRRWPAAPCRPRRPSTAFFSSSRVIWCVVLSVKVWCGQTFRRAEPIRGPCCQGPCGRNAP